MAAGCAAAALAAAVIGIPALRLRGLALGVTTLAFALATSAWLLRQDWLLGNGATVPKPQWTGYTLDLAKDYYLFALLMLGLGLVACESPPRRIRPGADRPARQRGRGAGAHVAAPTRKLQAYAVAGALAGAGRRRHRSRPDPC